MTELERRATLTLRPYLSKYPVIFDVGSNKGDWANILARNVTAVHCFEPNIKLNHYSQIRFDELTNITYSMLAVFSRCEEMPFFYFDNVNNGLSSVFYNQTWVDMGLPMKQTEVTSITLDVYCSQANVKYIDFLKIDVEGADVDVLEGAVDLLERKAIRFIQIEHSDHIKLSGHVFNDAVELVRRYGYDVFHFNGKDFEKYKGQEAENLYIMDKDFTQDWNGEFRKNTDGMKFEFSLEIGCFEGLTTCHICDFMLKENGRVICIDPLTDEYLPSHPDNEMFKGQYDRFIRNTTGKPVELMRMTSNEAFAQKGFRDYRFDFIYIDGDHRRDQVYKDGINAFEVCRVGGYILFDDYEWRNETKEGIDMVLRELGSHAELVVKGYQVMIKKNANRI